MRIDFEALHEALYQRMATIPELVTVSRVLRMWGDVKAAEQPALFVTSGNITPEQQRGLPPKWIVTATLYLYCRNDADPAVPPSTQLNKLISAIQDRMERQPQEGVALPYADIQNQFCTTFGGLCSHAWIAGTIETDEGTLGKQAVAIIPIEMVITS